MKKYRTPNGKVVDESVLRQKYGAKFDDLVGKGFFVEVSSGNMVETGVSSDFITPNGKVVSEKQLQEKYGDKFNQLVDNGLLKKKVTSDGTTTTEEPSTTSTSSVPTTSQSTLPSGEPLVYSDVNTENNFVPKFAQEEPKVVQQPKTPITSKPTYKKRGSVTNYIDKIADDVVVEQPLVPIWAQPSEEANDKYVKTQLQQRKNKINSGDLSVDDMKYLLKNDPTFTKSLITSLDNQNTLGLQTGEPIVNVTPDGGFVPDIVKPKEVAPLDVKLGKFVDILNKNAELNQFQQKKEKQSKLFDQVNNMLLNQSVIDEQIDINKLSQDEGIDYGDQLLNKADANKQKELSDLEIKYPKKKTTVDSGTFRTDFWVRSPDDESAYIAEKNAILEKYGTFSQLLGYARAKGIADKLNQVSSVMDFLPFGKELEKTAAFNIGEEMLRFSDRDKYKVFKNSNSLRTGIERDVIQSGIDILTGVVTPDKVNALMDIEKTADDIFPDKMKSLLYHKIGAVLNNDANLLYNPNPSLAEIDKVMSNPMFTQKERDFYLKNMRSDFMPINNIVGRNSDKIPQSGFINAMTGSAGSTLKGVGNFIAAPFRSKESISRDALFQSYDTRFQNVGEHPESLQEYNQLIEKQKEGGLTIDETKRLNELGKYTNVRSGYQEFVDATGNLTAQVLLQALGTKGLDKVFKAGGLVNMGAGGLTKIGMGEELSTRLAASVVAYGVSFDGYQKQAALMFPDAKDSWKASIYTMFNSAMESVTERIFKDERVFDAFTKDFHINLGTLLKSVTSEGLTQGVMKKSLKEIVTKSLKTAYKFAKETERSALEETVEEVTSSITQSLSTLVLNPSKFNEKEAWDDAVSTATTMFLHGQLVAIGAGAGKMRTNYSTIPLLSRLGIDMDFTRNVTQEVHTQFQNKEITQEERDDKLRVLNNAVQVNNQDAPLVFNDEKTKGKYFMMHLNENLLHQQLGKKPNGDLIISDPVQRTIIEKQIKDSEQKRLGILEGDIKINGDYEFAPKEFETQKIEKSAETPINVNPLVDETPKTDELLNPKEETGITNEGTDKTIQPTTVTTEVTPTEQITPTEVKPEEPIVEQGSKGKSALEQYKEKFIKPTEQVVKEEVVPENVVPKEPIVETTPKSNEVVDNTPKVEIVPKVEEKVVPKEEGNSALRDVTEGGDVDGGIKVKYGSADKDLQGNPQKQWMKPKETSEQVTDRLASFVEASDYKGREQSAYIDKGGENTEVKLRKDDDKWNWYYPKSKKPFASFDTAKDAIKFIQEQPFWDNGELNKNGRDDAYYAKIKAEHIKTELENGNILEDVKDGKISAKDAKSIIENAGLKVPKVFEEALSKHNTNKTTPENKKVEGNSVDRILKPLADNVGKYKSAKEFEDAHTQSDLMDLSNPEQHRFGRIFSDSGEGIQDLVDINNVYGKGKHSTLDDYKEANVPRLSNPEQKVTIYRSAHNEAKNIEAGDYVSFNKEYAENHDRGKLISLEVPAKDVIWQGNDFNEWIYSPKEIRDKYTDLQDFYDKNKSKTETTSPTNKPIPTDNTKTKEQGNSAKTENKKDVNTIEDKVVKIDEGNILVNQREDYRIEKNSEDKYTISSPTKSFEKIKTDRKGVQDFLKNKENSYENIAENGTPESETVTKSVESKAESTKEADLKSAVIESDKIIEHNVKEVPKRKRVVKKVSDKIDEVSRLKLNMKEQKADLLDQLGQLEKLMFAENNTSESDIENIKKWHKAGKIGSPFSIENLSFLKDKGYEVDGNSVKLRVKDDGEFSFPANEVLFVSELISSRFPSTENISYRDGISPNVGKKPKSVYYETALDRGSVERQQQFVDAAKENISEAERVLKQSIEDKDASTKKSAGKLLEIFKNDLAKQQEILRYAENIDYEVESNPELKTLASEISVSGRDILDAINKYGLELNKENAEKALFMDDINTNYGGLENAENRLLMERTKVDMDLQPFRYKDGREGYKNQPSNSKYAELNSLKNKLENIDSNLKYLEKNRAELEKLKENSIVNFQEAETPSEQLKAMTEVVQGFFEDNGSLSLKEAKDLVAEELGDRSQDKIVEEAYNAATRNLKITGENKSLSENEIAQNLFSKDWNDLTEKQKDEVRAEKDKADQADQSPFRKEGEVTTKNPNELTTSFAKRLNNFVGKLFGTKGELVSTLDGTDAIMQKAKEIGNGLFSIINIPLQKIKDYADQIITGKTVFERFSPQEQRGITAGGEIHAEATLILARESGTGKNDAATNEQQENSIERYAKDKGVWIDNPTQTLSDKYGKPIGAGEEALVWDNGTTVIKSQNTYQYGDLQRKLDGITLQNATFPETAVKVLGFGRNKFGDFQVIVEQPFVIADKTGINDASDPIQVARKKKLGKEYFEKLGFNHVEKNDYSNDQTLISDLHNGNFVITPEGKVAVIDPVMQLNTPEEGYGGTRVVSNTVRGVDGAVNFQVEGYHGSPYAFDKFSMDKVGTGEGAQAFGYGLYFTDVESIANKYREQLTDATRFFSLDGKKVSNEDTQRLILGYLSEGGKEIKNNSFSQKDYSTPEKWVTDNQSFKETIELAKKVIDDRIKIEKAGIKILNDAGLPESAQLDFKNRLSYLQDLSDGYEVVKKIKLEGTGNVYKVALHEGKTPEQYNWLEWDKKPSESQKNKIIELAKKEGVEKIGNKSLLINGKITPQEVPIIDALNYFPNSNQLYSELSRKLGSDKAASEFLLRAGIDGIKYPAESLSRGATSDNARGFNYVVFDENAVTIKERVQFMYNRKGEVLGITNPKTGEVFVNGETINPNTPIHEVAGHLYINWLENNPEIGNNKAILEEGFNKIRLEKRYLEKVNNKEFYKEEALKQGKEGSEAYKKYMLKEALATAIGDNGAQFFMESRKKSFRAWADNLWKKVAEYFGIRNKSVAELHKMTFGDFMKSIAADVLDPNAEFAKQEKGKQTANENTTSENVKPVDLSKVPKTSELFDITHKSTAELLEKYGLPERDYEPQTVLGWIKEADDRIANGELESVINKIRDGGFVTAVDQIMLAKHIAALDQVASNTMSNSDLKALHDAIRLSDKVVGTETARTFRARQVRFVQDDTLGTALFNKMEDINADILTEEQKKEVKDQWVRETEQRELNDKAQKAARVRAENKVMTQAAKKVFESQKTVKVSSEKANELIEAARQRIKDKIRQSQAKNAPKFSVNFEVEGDPETARVLSDYITPELAEEVLAIENIFRSQGLSFEDTVSSTFDSVKDLFTELSKQDVIDIIGGKYDTNKTKKQILREKVDFDAEKKILQTLIDLEKNPKLDIFDRLFSKKEAEQKKKNAINGKIKEARVKLESLSRRTSSVHKRLARERINKLREEANNGGDIDTINKQIESEYKLIDSLDIPIDSGQIAANELQKSIARNEAKLENAKEQVRISKGDAFAQKRLDELETSIKSEKRDLEDAKAKALALRARQELLEKSQSDIAEKIKANQFKPEVAPVKVVLTKDEQAIEDALISLQNARMLRSMKDRYNPSKHRQISDALNIFRAAMATGDLSGLGRQGAMVISGYPAIAAQASKFMIQAAASEKLYNRWMHQTQKNDPRFDDMMDLKLALTDINNPDTNAHEESFQTTLLDNIPVYNKFYKGSERAYSAVLNKMRVDLYNYFADKLEEQGKTVENSREQYEWLTSYINTITGRGNLAKGAMSDIAPFLNALFFSPRLIAARLNTLSYWARPSFYKNAPKEVKVAYFADVLKFMAMNALISLLASAYASYGDDDDDISVDFFNPTSSDFMKVKVNNTRVDQWAGFQQYITLAARIASGHTTTSTGKVKQFGEGYKADTRLDVLLRSVRGKMSPLLGMGMDMFGGEDFIGRKLKYEMSLESNQKEMSVPRYMIEHLLPMSLIGSAEAINDVGWTKGTAFTVMNILGWGTTTYDERESTGKSSKSSKSPKSPKSQNQRR